VYGDEFDAVFHALERSLHRIRAMLAAFHHFDAENGDVRANFM